MVKQQETQRQAGRVPRCDFPGCVRQGTYGFDVKGAYMPTHLEKWACLDHRAWGKAYWETING